MEIINKRDKIRVDIRWIDNTIINSWKNVTYLWLGIND